MTTNFSISDLVWAKMKGFPPWPASITSCPKILRDGTTANGKYSVIFFGTKETAQMKSTELFPYLEYRSSFEQIRKHKGFNEGVKEIRCAAGIDEDQKPDIQQTLRLPSKSSKEEGSIGSRIRKPSSRLNAEEFVLAPTRTRSTSKSVVDSNIIVPTTTAAMTSVLKNSVPPSAIGNKRGRFRTDSNCSNGSSSSLSKRSKRVSYSDKLGLDFGLDFDPILNAGSDPVFVNACLGSNSMSLLEEHNDDDRARTRRRTRSRVFDDLLMSPGKSPFRDRSRSISSNGGRSRLASGYSDAFDDLIESAHSIFNASALMAAIDQLPSEDSDRPLTPEEPLPMPPPLKTCYSCGCQCELLGLKWRCTSKLCLKWNGTHQPYPVPSTSDVEEEVPEKSSEQLEIEKAVNAIKQEASTFEQNQQQRERQLFLNQQQQANQQHQPVQDTHSHHHQHPLNFAHVKQEHFDGFSGLGTRFHSVRTNDSMQYSPMRGAGFINGQQPSISPSSSLAIGEDGETRKKCGRPKSYKVEKTPAMRPDGRRLCSLCNGEVRPQMCGGNKHRWRCVDKKCRKWYGWVLSCDEIPNDLGKKGRWKDLVVKVRQPGSGGLDEEGFAVNSLFNGTHNGQFQHKRIGRPPKVFMEDDPNQDKIRTKFPPPQGSDQRYRRKYTKRKRSNDIEIQRPISPLTLRQMSYEPSAVERHSRWWLVTRRRQELSPVRGFPTSVFNNGAALRLISGSMFSASKTKADEPGTLDGTMDLLLDMLMSSMAPLLSLINKIPATSMNNEHTETTTKLWNACSIHTPMF